MKTALLFMILSTGSLLYAEDDGKTYRAVCATCHGQHGEGSVVLKSPSIAGLPAWYSLIQIEKISKELRSAGTNDVHLLAMREILKTITPAELASTATYIAKLKRHPTVNTLGGDSKRGETLYAQNCMSCHRYNASGERVFKSAPLTGLQDWYMTAQFEKYRDLLRGPRTDTSGHKMHLVATHIKNDDDLRDILAYIAVLASKQE